jgi:hypothetical protein
MAVGDKKIVRLTSGEELLATITKSRKGEFTTGLKDVAIIIPQEQNVGLMHFAPYTTLVETKRDAVLEIDDRHIMFMMDPVDGLVQHYDKIFGKIIAPKFEV